MPEFEVTVVMFEKFLKLDWILIISSWLLLGIGLLVLYSISTADSEVAKNGDIFWRQMIFASVGILLMAVFSFLNYRYLWRNSTLIYFLALIILATVLLFGDTIRGTSGWLAIGPFHIQPVELAKVLLVISLASFISKSRTNMSEFLRIIATTLIAGVVIVLVIKQPDFGSAMILMVVFINLLIFSGINQKYLASLFVVGIIVAGSSWFFMADYQQARIKGIFNQESDPRGNNYNVIQSKIAIGSGGMVGKGLGHGSQSQFNFLPEKHTDFIFAVVAEEFGMWGAWLVIFLVGVILYRIKKIAQSAKDNFGYLFAIGIMTIFFVQILINIGMNMGIVPVTGIPLPLLSYGGSSLLSVFISLGILNNIYSQRKKELEIAPVVNDSGLL